ncbi:hypothetical protein K501DRAFT_56839 [Backusella circina FSU 941]|nr:hypothetical protein K501DRAFT_56839 [Backusella circina FSU 941]
MLDPSLTCSLLHLLILNHIIIHHFFLSSSVTFHIITNPAQLKNYKYLYIFPKTFKKKIDF